MEGCCVHFGFEGVCSEYLQAGGRGGGGKMCGCDGKESGKRDRWKIDRGMEREC